MPPRKTKAQGSVSSHFTWDTETEEHFAFLGHEWDVRGGKRRLVEKPRGVDRITLADIEALAPRIGGEEVDPEKVDLSLPVLLVTTEGGNIVPIDGWNRIRKALKEGVKDLPAVLLNKRESAAIKRG